MYYIFLGLECQVNGYPVVIGNLKFMEKEYSDVQIDFKVKEWVVKQEHNLGK